MFQRVFVVLLMLVQSGCITVSSNKRNTDMLVRTDTVQKTEENTKLDAAFQVTDDEVIVATRVTDTCYETDINVYERTWYDERTMHDELPAGLGGAAGIIGGIVLLAIAPSRSDVPEIGEDGEEGFSPQGEMYLLGGTALALGAGAFGYFSIKAIDAIDEETDGGTFKDSPEWGDGEECNARPLPGEEAVLLYVIHDQPIEVLKGDTNDRGQFVVPLDQIRDLYTSSVSISEDKIRVELGGKVWVGGAEELLSKALSDDRDAAIAMRMQEIKEQVREAISSESEDLEDIAWEGVQYCVKVVENQLRCDDFRGVTKCGWGQEKTKDEVTVISAYETLAEMSPEKYGPMTEKCVKRLLKKREKAYRKAVKEREAERKRIERELAQRVPNAFKQCRKAKKIIRKAMRRPGSVDQDTLDDASENLGDAAMELDEEFGRMQDRGASRKELEKFARKFVKACKPY